MNYRYLNLTILTAGLLTTSLAFAAVPLTWATVVNNNDYAPGSAQKKFYSYNQPSVNSAGLVVFRARAKNPTPGGEGGNDNPGASEGGGPTRGVFTRDMVYLTPIATVASNESPYDLVPDPNNTLHPGLATFNEFPSFPRIDKSSGTAAFRGQSTPSWEVPDIGKVGGTSGVYAGLAGDLKTGMRNIEPSYFPEYLVPQNALPMGALPTRFDQFPGAPSPTANLVVFKGNYATTGGSRTGVFYRKVPGNSANNTVQMIANSETTCIPGTDCTKFGSTAPPSAADKKAVFVGLDNEDNPTMGGVYFRDLKDTNPKATPAPLVPLAEIDKTKVPGFNGQPLDGTSKFARFGEALSFDGRYVAFWGSWGSATKTVKLVCPDEGNKAVIEYCKANENNKVVAVPLNQGMFVYDTRNRITKMAARTASENEDFLYWNFSGRPPGVGGGHGGEESEDETEDYEEPRWRSTSFVAVDGERVAYKARSGDLEDTGLWSDPVDGIYLKNTAGNGASPVATLLDTTTSGAAVDPAAVDSTISAIGIERDGFRKGWLAINASMVVLTEGTEADETEETGWAGIYLTHP
jgi:hypothetical protein